ncbi:MAG: hypothetical protein FWF09_04635 [Bacteroidales bacterium]|nr:hypothetical protein [Bacteroidales bacterium]
MCYHHLNYNYDKSAFNANLFRNSNGALCRGNHSGITNNFKQWHYRHMVAAHQQHRYHYLHIYANCRTVCYHHLNYNYDKSAFNANFFRNNNGILRRCNHSGITNNLKQWYYRHMDAAHQQHYYHNLHIYSHCRAMCYHHSNYDYDHDKSTFNANFFRNSTGILRRGNHSGITDNFKQRHYRHMDATHQ